MPNLVNTNWPTHTLTAGRHIGNSMWSTEWVRQRWPPSRATTTSRGRCHVWCAVMIAQICAQANSHARCVRAIASERGIDLHRHSESTWCHCERSEAIPLLLLGDCADPPGPSGAPRLAMTPRKLPGGWFPHGITNLVSTQFRTAPITEAGMRPHTTRRMIDRKMLLDLCILDRVSPPPFGTCPNPLPGEEIIQYKRVMPVMTVRTTATSQPRRNTTARSGITESSATRIAARTGSRKYTTQPILYPYLSRVPCFTTPR